MVASPAAGVRARFQHVVDPRAERTKRHRLLDIIAIALCGVPSGADTWVEIGRCGRERADWLRGFLELPNGIPSHDTFGRVFAALDPGQFEQGFRSWAAAAAGLRAGEGVAIDGKVLRGAHDRAGGKGPPHLVSAWACQNRLTLGQLKVGDGANEIVAIPELLETLALEGCVVTIDAIGCQTAIARQVVAKGAEYVLALKDNQEGLHDGVKRLFAAERPRAFAGLRRDSGRAVDKGHGRLEIRRTWTVSDPAVLAYLNEGGRWPRLRSVAMAEAERRVGGASTTEARYYISGLPGAAGQVGAAVRGHWGIEDGPHWVLDAAFREGQSRVRRGHADQNLAVVRRLALNLLRREESAKVGAKAKRPKAAWSTDYLGKLLAHLAP